MRQRMHVLVVAVVVVVAAAILALSPGLVNTARADGESSCLVARNLLMQWQRPGVDREQFYQVLQQTQRMCPDLGLAYSQEAVMWAEAKDGGKAEQYLEMALTKSPDDDLVKKDALRVYLLLNKLAMAQQYADQLAGGDSSDVATMSSIGAVYLRSGRIREAEQYLTTCAEVDSFLGTCDFELGKLYLEKGQESLAMAAFENAKRKNSVEYNDYTIDAVLESHHARYWTLLFILAVLLLLGIAGGTVFYRRKREAEEKAREKKEEKTRVESVPVEMAVRGRIGGSLGGLEISTTGYYVDVTCQKDAYLCMFYISNTSGIAPMNIGRSIEVFPVTAGEKVEGSVFTRVPGEMLQCYALARSATFSYERDIEPEIMPILNALARTDAPATLPVKKNLYGQAHCVVKG